MLVGCDRAGSADAARGALRSGAVSEEAFAAYLAAGRDPEVVRGWCEDYRAAASIDLEHDRADRDAGRRITCPLLALWGSRNPVWQQYPTSSRSGASTPSTSAAKRWTAVTTSRRRNPRGRSSCWARSSADAWSRGAARGRRSGLTPGCESWGSTPPAPGMGSDPEIAIFGDRPQNQTVTFVAPGVPSRPCGARTVADGARSVTEAEAPIT